MKKLLIIIYLLISVIQPIVANAESEQSEINEAIIEQSIETSNEDDEPKEVIITEDKTEKIKTDTIPMRPTNLRCTNITTDSISIVWDDNMGYDEVNSYNIYVNGEKIGSSKLSTYVINNLLPGQNYEITITAVNYYGESFESDTLEVKTLSMQAPHNIKINNVTGNSAYITWNGKGPYNVYLNGNFVDSTSENYYQFDNLEENKYYEVVIESYFDNNIYDTVQIKTGQSIQQENVIDIINIGFNYISIMWPYISVIAGLIIAFAIADMMLGTFEKFRVG